MIFGLTNLYDVCGFGFCVFWCGLKIVKVCVSRENYRR